ncbi:MAG: periplasmic heavy metal sensor [Acidobacteria bacterium]|nr:periplasmic heavy metal sensor [Acidobacteriota bacterium]
MKATEHILSAALALVLTLAAAGWAQQPPTGAPQQRGQQRIQDAIKTVLDLSDRQFAEMTELRDAHQAKLKEYSDENRTLEQSKRAIMQASGADPVKIGSITLRQDALTQMIQQENEAYHIGSLALLTATQRDKVIAIEAALKLAPSAGALMQFGLLDTAVLGGRGGFMGMAPGQGFGGQGGPGMMMRGGPPPQN